MAANFWTSSHAAWLTSKQRIKLSQDEDKRRGLTPEQITQLKVFFTQSIHELASCNKLRQRVAATAVVYFRRFYLRHSFCQHDPWLVAPGCLYLASKAEESLLAARHIVASMKKRTAQPQPLTQPSQQQRPPWKYEIKHLLEVEMIILEALDFHLLVFSPYPSLIRFLQNSVQLAEIAQPAWAALNDIYRTDLPLVYPPHVLALGCLVVASMVCGIDLGAWLQGLSVDLDQVYDICLDMLDMYEHYSLLTVEECHSLLDTVRS